MELKIDVKFKNWWCYSCNDKYLCSYRFGDNMKIFLEHKIGKMFDYLNSFNKLKRLTLTILIFVIAVLFMTIIMYISNNILTDILCLTALSFFSMMVYTGIISFFNNRWQIKIYFIVMIILIISYFLFILSILIFESPFEYLRNYILFVQSLLLRMWFND